MLSPAPRSLIAPPVQTLSAPNLTAAAALLGGQQSVASTHQFQLNGIVRAAYAQDSVAIISAAGNAAQTVKVGDKLAADTRLSEIQADYVVLTEHGNARRVALAADHKPVLKVNQLSPVATP